MVEGFMAIGTAPQYEDYASLKKYLNANKGTLFSAINLIKFHRNQAGTGAAVEIEEKAGQTIAQIGKTEITVDVAIVDGDDADYNGETLTMVYVDADGTSHTAVCTMTATMHTTSVEFDEDVTDFYAMTSLTSSITIKAGDTLIVHTTGDENTVWGTISAAATEATEAQLMGVGAIYGSSEADHTDADSVELYMSYVTPWGAIKYAHCTFDTNAGNGTDTAIRFFEAADDGDFTTTATTTTVKDYYRTRWLTNSAVGTTNSHSQRITNAGKSAVYAAIEELYPRAIFSRYVCPTGRSAWLAKISISQAIATNLDCYMTVTFTPYGQTIATTSKISIPNNGSLEKEPIMRLAANTEIYFTVLGNLSDNAFDFQIIEAVEV